MESLHRTTSQTSSSSKGSGLHLSSANLSSSANRKGKTLDPGTTNDIGQLASLSIPRSGDQSYLVRRFSGGAESSPERPSLSDAAAIKPSLSSPALASQSLRGLDHASLSESRQYPVPIAFSNLNIVKMAGNSNARGDDQVDANASDLAINEQRGTTTALSPISALGAPSSTATGFFAASNPQNSGNDTSTAAQQFSPDTQTILPQQIARAPRGRAHNSKRASTILSGTVSPNSDRSAGTSMDSNDQPRRSSMGIIGICALDSKARSKANRNILNRINSNQEFELIIFGDKVILDEEPANWPICDYLISFFSSGFPLDKAIEYVRLRKPFSVNDLPMQRILWDRRLCLQILDKWEVPTPKRIEVNRDGGPRFESVDLANHVRERAKISLPGRADGTGGGSSPPKEVRMLDDDTLSVDGIIIKKPFVEKPVSGEDHNIRIYFPTDAGGGGRRLFRKVNNKSSEADETLNIPRAITEKDGSYIYESFLSPQNCEDVKAYTVGPDYCHAETRKSPFVDGIVKRNTHGKEMRYVTSLNPEETKMATRIAEAFGQRVCGFDMLRVNNESFVIDINGWSFVKDNETYYNKCAAILRQLFVDEKMRKEPKMDCYDGDAGEIALVPVRGSSSHLSSLKSIFMKSPSRSRLSGHHHGRASPESANWTPAMTLAPSYERAGGVHINQIPTSAKDALPPPAYSTSAGNDGQSGSTEAVPLPATNAQWKLKGMVAVIRHADRTPKQKFKFTFHTKPFVDLLKGHREEVLLVGEAALRSVMDAVRKAVAEGVEDPDKLKLLRTSLVKKGGWPGTKVQIKPMFRKKRNDNENENESAIKLTPSHEEKQKKDGGSQIERQHRQGSLNGVTLSREAAAEDNLDFEKLQLIVKWGGEPTHASRYQAQELGNNMRTDLILMNRDALENLTVFSSSEKRVTTSAQIWASAFLDQKDLPPDYVQVRKDLLDDSNAAKDEMDKVKKKLKGLLRQGEKAPSQFAWPENTPEPYVIAGKTVDLMQFHRRVMRDNFASLHGSAASSLAGHVKQARSNSTGGIKNMPSALKETNTINNIQNRWCCGEDAELFKERWEKLFAEFCDPEKIDPSKISELHDTMKFDTLHNRQFLEWVFTPSQTLIDEYDALASASKSMPNIEIDNPPSPQQAQSFKDAGPLKRTNTDKEMTSAKRSNSEKPSDRGTFAHRMGFRKRADMDPTALRNSAANPAVESYFNLFTGSARSKAKTDARLEKLRELFLYSKILFDFIGPQEYGILDSEKLEIGLLTSLPLLRAIVNDLEQMQASEGAKTCVYFTKESHVYTLLNCIIEGGIHTKIERNKIPELDYLSTICFELYESQNNNLDDGTQSFNYSIRITISPGCHTFEPLDV